LLRLRRNTADGGCARVSETLPECSFKTSYHLMRPIPTVVVLFLVLQAALVRAAPENRPIALHPDNPHYFVFHGKPTVLVGSTEHYGAVLNNDFDNVKYLDTIQREGLNLTRTFSCTYR